MTPIQSADVLSPASLHIQIMEDSATPRTNTVAQQQTTDELTTDERIVPVDKRILSAARAGNVTEILRHKGSVVRIARNDSESSPLHVAVGAGLEKVVCTLLSSNVLGGDGAPAFSAFDFLHACNRKGYTAIHVAVISGSESILKLLISKYKEVLKRPDYEWDFADVYWMTPLHYAVLGNQKGAMRQLLEWKDYDKHVNAREYFQRTPLYLASYHRPVSVDELLQHPGVDINAKDCLSLTPLHWAVYFGRTDVVESLVKHRVNENRKQTIQAVWRDTGGRTALEISMEDRLLDLIPSLSNKLSFAVFDYDQRFLREEAATSHREVNVDIQKLLLDCPDVNAEKEDLYKNLGIYVNAINGILLVAALIAGAAISMSTDSLNTNSKSNLVRVFFFLNLVSFYGSVATVLAGATILQPLGKSVPIARRVKYARLSLSITSMMVAFSLCFCLASFYAQNAARVEEAGSVLGLRISYSIASSIAIVLCFTLVLFFMRLHQHMRHISSEVEVTKERITMWSDAVWTAMILWLLFLLGKTCFRALSMKFEAAVLQHYAINYGAKGQKRRIFGEAEKLYDVHMKSESESSPSRDMVEDPTFIKIRKEMENAYKGAWKSTRMRIFGAGNRSQENSKRPELLAEKYWRRCKISPRDRRLFQRVQKEIEYVDRAYRKLTGDPTKNGNTGRRVMCYLDLLPLGPLFWLDNWVLLCKEKVATVYCGFILDKDVTMYNKLQKELEKVE